MRPFDQITATSSLHLTFSLNVGEHNIPTLLARRKGKAELLLDFTLKQALPKDLLAQIPNVTFIYGLITALL
jgi:hypothetical protein